MGGGEEEVGRGYYYLASNDSLLRLVLLSSASGMLVQRVVIYIFQKDLVGTPLPECVLSMSLYAVSSVWKEGGRCLLRGMTLKVV